MSTSRMFWLMSAMCVFTLANALTKRSADFCMGKPTGYYKDPMVCDKFYQCFNGITYQFTCIPGTQYDVKSMTCLWRRYVDCTLPDQSGSGSDVRKKNGYRRRTSMKSTMPFMTYQTYKPKTTTRRHRNYYRQKTTTTRQTYRPKMATTRQTYRPKTTTTRQTYRPKMASTRQTYRPKTTRPAGRSTNEKCKKIVCYFANWPQYRKNGGKHIGTDLDPNLCTHIIYAFANLRDSQITHFEWNDILGGYKNVTNLKLKNPSLKVLLAIGGWNMGSAPFTDMVKTEESRAKFIKGVILFLRQWEFDGLDLDWEYPANRGSPPEDKGRFSALVIELNREFRKEARSSGLPRLLLTAAVPAGKEKIETGYDVPVMNENLDFINVMSYDFFFDYISGTTHHSPLFSGSMQTDEKTQQLNIDWALQFWVERGAEKKKLIVGMATYGRAFTLSSSSNAKNGAPTTGRGNPGKRSAEAGFLCYHEICEMEKTDGAVKTVDPDQKTPFLALGNQWVGYDDVQSLEVKVEYVRKMKYGGVMIWDTSCDDFTGEFCPDSSQGRPYPLLNAIKDTCYR